MNSNRTPNVRVTAAPASQPAVATDMNEVFAPASVARDVDPERFLPYFTTTTQTKTVAIVHSNDAIESIQAEPPAPPQLSAFGDRMQTEREGELDPRQLHDDMESTLTQDLETECRAFYHPILLRMARNRKCYYCGKIFCTLQNYGQWECNYHPRSYDPIQQEFPCCGLKTKQYMSSDRGCTPCDHSPVPTEAEIKAARAAGYGNARWHKRNRKGKVALGLLRLFEPRPESITKVNNQHPDRRLWYAIVRHERKDRPGEVFPRGRPQSWLTQHIRKNKTLLDSRNVHTKIGRLQQVAV
jgi:hypothetical protein